MVWLSSRFSTFFSVSLFTSQFSFSLPSSAPPFSMLSAIFVVIMPLVGMAQVESHVSAIQSAAYFSEKWLTVSQTPTISSTELSLAIRMPYGSTGTLFSPHKKQRKRSYVILDFFSTKQLCRAVLERVKLLIFRSTMLWGVHSLQVIVTLASYGECISGQHGKTLNVPFQQV